MSEAVRNYQGMRFSRAHRRRKTTRRIVYALMGLVLGVLFWAYWNTRDTHNMASLIPGEQSYAVYVPDLLSRRDTITASPLWDLLPADSPYTGWRQSLADNLGLPEWVLNNFIYGLCHVSGRDVDQFSDVLLVTRMTSVGTLLEKLHGFSDLVRADHAGGLNIRVVPDFGIYYAVRGRVLVVSPNRETVIRALTLTDETAVTEERLADAERSLQGELLLGRFRLAEDNTFGQYIDGAEVRVWLDKSDARAVLRVRPHPVWRETLEGLVGAPEAKSLRVPPPGPVQISADFGVPVPELWAIWGEKGGIPDPWESATTFLEGQNPAYVAQNRALLDALRNSAGSRWQLTWADINMDAILPVPEFLLAFDTPGGNVAGIFPGLPAAPPAGDPWAVVPRYDAAHDLVSIPLMAGPAFAPTVGAYGEGLLLSNSETAAARALGIPADEGAVSEKGNLYARAVPRTTFEMCMRALEELAEYGLLKNQTPASLENAAAPYRNLANKIADVRLVAGMEDQAVRVDLRLTMTPAAETAPTEEAQSAQQ